MYSTSKRILESCVEVWSADGSDRSLRLMRLIRAGKKLHPLAAPNLQVLSSCAVIFPSYHAPPFHSHRPNA